MARCTQKGCNWYGKKRGLKMHLFRVHGIRTKYEDLASQSKALASESKVCPVPGCGLHVPDLQAHLSQLHEDWRLSSGKFVFEVV